MKDLLGFVLVSVAIVAVGFMQKPAQVNVETDSLGAFPGSDIVNRVTTYGGFAQGGQFTIATTASAMTLGNADMSNNAVISVSAMGAGQAALALTTPGSTTWSGLNKPGVVQSWIVDNTSTAAATTTTITAGAGVDIDGTTGNDDVLNGGTAGVLSCWRLSASDTPANGVRCIVEEMVDAG